MGKMSTLVSQAEWEKRLREEGIDPKLASAMTPRWHESAPKMFETKSALVRCDLILRSDSSCVYLDGQMGLASMILAEMHTSVAPAPSAASHVKELFPEVAHLACIVPAVLSAAARSIVGWETYVKRMTECKC